MFGKPNGTQITDSLSLFAAHANHIKRSLRRLTLYTRASKNTLVSHFYFFHNYITGETIFPRFSFNYVERVFPASLSSEFFFTYFLGSSRTFNNPPDNLRDAMKLHARPRFDYARRCTTHSCAFTFAVLVHATPDACIDATIPGAHMHPLGL